MSAGRMKEILDGLFEKAMSDPDDFEEFEAFLKLCEADKRTVVRQNAARCRRELEKYRKEEERLDRMLVFEREYCREGLVCGIDEAGRGPLAGPVVAGAVILPEDCRIMWLNDSKQLSGKMREKLFDEILEKAVSVGTGIVGPDRIDEINILQADYEAMRQAVAGLTAEPAVLLNDAVTIPGLPYHQVPIIKGDAKSLSIAAASVIAKVTRDRIMCEYDKLYPQYGFAAHKGYGSAAHMEAIRRYGPCPIHRKTFLKNLLSDEGPVSG